MVYILKGLKTFIPINKYTNNCAKKHYKVVKHIAFE